MQDWSKCVEKPYQEVLEELKAEGYQVVSDGLLRYCELDTWAMVKVWEKLKEKAGVICNFLAK